MFTGIIEQLGTIRDTRPVPTGRRLCVDVGSLARECEMGSSVCVSGVCLTVAGSKDATLEFDVVSETLRRSTLGAKGNGDHVNIERSLRVGDRLDGHFVQGHVDGTSRVQRVVQSSGEHMVWFVPEQHLMPYIIEKGSVSLDGVSLTIADVAGDTFSVALIPTTLERTTLANLAVGDAVNVESDVIARAVVDRVTQLSSQGALSLETLRQAGFA